jgi:hypothetical protein
MESVMVDLRPVPDGQKAAAEAQEHNNHHSTARLRSPTAGKKDEPPVHKDELHNLLEKLTAQTVTRDTTSWWLFRKSSPLARLIILTRKLSDIEAPESLYQQAYHAARLLEAGPENNNEAHKVIENLEYATSVESPLSSVMIGIFQSVFMIGLVIFCITLLRSIPHIAAIMAVLSDKTTIMKSTYSEARPFEETLFHPLMISAMSGVAGAVVSLMLRLPEFESASRKSSQFLQLTGAMLPLVGALFAVIICSIFRSGLVNFQFATPNQTMVIPESEYFFIVVGFLSGFSERFTRGLLGQAERSVSASPHSGEATPPSKT